MTIGTHLDHSYKDVLAAHVRALAKQSPGDDVSFHRRAAGRGRGGAGEGNFHRYSFVSYDDYLRRYDAVAHHGGDRDHVSLSQIRHPGGGDAAGFRPVRQRGAARACGGRVCGRERRGEIGAALARVMEDRAMAERCRELAGCMARYDPAETISRFMVDESVISKYR